jgi:hypothetical protein
MRQVNFVFLILIMASVVIAGQETVKNGVVYIVNNDVPSQGIETLELRELWRIGGEDEEFIFRAIDKVLLAEDGDLYILDGMSGVIYVNSLDDGSLIRQINISGEGPGELSFANNMFLMEEDQIALLRPHPAKIVCIDYQGIPQPSVDLTGDSFFIAGTADWSDGVLVVAGASAEIRAGQTFVARYNRYGEMYRYESYSTRSSAFQAQMTEEDEYFMISKPWVIGEMGELYLAPYWAVSKDYYLINVYDDDGQLIRVITRDFVSYQRSHQEKKQIVLQKFCGENGLRLLTERGFEYLAEDYEPDISEIYAHPDNNIWVSTSRSVRDQDSDVIITYDVFSSRGHFLKQVSLEGDGDGQKDIVYFIDQDRVILVKGQLDAKFGCEMSTEADILEIICYAIN